MSRVKLALKTLTEVSVVTAGTPVPLSATSLLVLNASVQFADTNTGDIYVGESDVAINKCLVLNGSTPSLNLEAEDTAADEDAVVFDLADIYIDAANSGDKVRVAYTLLEAIAYNS